MKRLLFAVVALLLVTPILAQDLSNEEQTYWEEIQAAMTSTTELSFRLEGQQTLEQVIDMDVISINQQVIQVIDGSFVNDGDIQNAYLLMKQEMNQDMGVQQNKIQLTQEMVTLDGELFVQYSEVSPATLESFYPDSWVLFEEAATQYQGLAAINAEQLLELMNAQSLTTPFAELSDTLKTITKLDDTEIDGQAMNVYETIYDADRLFSDEYIDEAMGMFNLDALGASLDTIAVEDGATIKHVYYIGQDDGLLYRSTAEITMTMSMEISMMSEAQAMDLDQTMNQSFNYMDYGSDITLPDVETAQ